MRSLKNNRTLKLSNFTQRILTGAVFIAILLGSILYGEYTSLALFAIILVFSLVEFYGLLNREKAVSLNIPMLVSGGLLLYLGMYSVFTSLFPPFLSLFPFLLWMMALFVSELYMKKESAINSLAYASLGLLYIALPLGLTTYLAFNYDANTYHFVYLLALFVFIWVNDTFAYLVGSLFGKHRLFERISPKKSWEGFVGGVLFTIISSLLFAYFFQEQSVVIWMGFACIVVIAGTFGDLLESLFKRELGVKDSGNILPGHGGILDRFDSMLFSIVPLVIYLEICGFLQN